MSYTPNTTNQDYSSNHKQHVSHFGVAKTGPTIIVLKSNFPSASVDPIVWSETSENGATVTVQDGYAKLLTNTGSGSLELTTNKTGRFEAGQVTVYQAGVYAGTGSSGIIKRWGLGNVGNTEGLFFELSGSDFYASSVKDGVQTRVTASAFSGETTFTPGNTNNTYRIEYSAGRAIFYRAAAGAKVLLHSMIDTQEPLVNDLNLKIRYSMASNGGGQAEMRVRGSSVSVWGSLNQYNRGGGLLITDFVREVAKGGVTGYSHGTISGYNPSIGTGVSADVWAAGGLYPGQPSSGGAETVGVFSSNANDTSAGTGARTVRLTGLDENWDMQTEDLTLNGTTQVAGTSLWRRVWLCEVLTGGSSGGNLGTITGRHTTTTANIFFEMGIGYNSTSVAAFTVPRGKIMYFLRNKMHIVRANGSAGSAVYTVRSRTPGGVYKAVRGESVSTNSPDDYTFVGLGEPIPEKTDVKVRIESVSDTATRVSSAIEYLLIKDSFL